ncbi:hypothetical protein PENSPDRAFT_735452 [Peniophora sp. CONT]|nr:hypothetical protein PENSPDRAFT_735452 [Peniophora sp. CONT]
MAPTTTVLTASLSSTIHSIISPTLRPTRSLIVLAAQTALQAPTLTSTPSTPSSSHHKHLSTGAIVGIATVGVVAFISICALTIGLCVMFTNRRRARRAPSKTYLRSRHPDVPQTQMRTTFDPPVSRPTMFELHGWKRMTDEQDSTRTRTDSSQSQAAPSEHAAPESGPALFEPFRFEKGHSGKLSSHKKRWSQLGHKNLPLTPPLSPLNGELQLARLSEIKL